MNAFDIIEQEIRKHAKTVIIGHVQPDGDCMGSSFGMKYLLKENYGVDAVVVNQPIKRYAYLGEWEKPGTVDLEDAFVIQLDNAVAERSAEPNLRKAGLILKIDHHLVVDSYGTYNVEELTSSCCEIVAAHAIEKGLTITKEAAQALYTGMVTDTGRFSYGPVTGDTMRIVATLLDTGFDAVETINNIERRSMNNVNFISYAYSQLKVSKKGVLYIYISQEIIDRYSLTPDMVSQALQCMRNIEDHPIMVLFADLMDKVRVEFRSDRINIVEVARKFGGGGHAFASGARLKSPEEIPLVVRELEKYMPN